MLMRNPEYDPPKRPERRHPNSRDAPWFRLDGRSIVGFIGILILISPLGLVLALMLSHVTLATSKAPAYIDLRYLHSNASWR